MELEKISIDKLRSLIKEGVYLILYIERDQYEYIAENVKDISNKLWKKIKAHEEKESLLIRLHWPEVNHMYGDEEGFDFYEQQKFENYGKYTVIKKGKIKTKEREISWKTRDIPILPKKYWIISNG